MHTYQGQQGKISDRVDSAADKIEQLEIDAATSRLGLNSSSKGVPEGGKWCASPDRDRNEGDSETEDKYRCAKKHPPKMDDGENAVQE